MPILTIQADDVQCESKMERDILETIPDEDLPELKKLYENQSPYGDNVFYLLQIATDWAKKKPEERYLNFFAPHGDWKSSGTFVLVMKFGLVHQMLLSTLEKKSEMFFGVLTETKRIDWKMKPRICFLLNEHTPFILKALEFLNVPNIVIRNTIQWISKEEALAFDIDHPDDVYIKKLDKTSAPLINGVWPHRCDGSDLYLSVLIEMNNTAGIFLKESGELLAWILTTQLGALGVLQTVEDQKRKGYASLLTKYMSKEIAKAGYNPIATVVVGNTASETLFENLGFKNIGLTAYIIPE